MKTYNFHAIKNCLNWKCSIAENSRGLFTLPEHRIVVNILRLHLGKCEKLKLHIDEPPYYTRPFISSYIRDVLPLYNSYLIRYTPVIITSLLLASLLHSSQGRTIVKLEEKLEKIAKEDKSSLQKNALLKNLAFWARVIWTK